MVENNAFEFTSNKRIKTLRSRFIKRFFDIVFSSLIIIFILPFLTIVILFLHILFDQGPIFYKSIRWGKNSKRFYCYKYRTMKNNSHNNNNEGSYRCEGFSGEQLTKFGLFLRRTNLDEFPQFINVFLGDMSIVGPRPHDEKENLEIKDRINSYMLRHSVKPGITGWAQVNGYKGGTKDIELMKKRTQYDLWYIENWSFFLDMRIILFTVWKNKLVSKS